MEKEQSHLGDGVYVSHDDYHIIIRANDHRNPHSVALDPHVFKSLIDYRDRVFNKPKK